ncbi:MAG: FAD-binding oxidoreductase, partial [Desulfobacterales bacterium]
PGKVIPLSDKKENTLDLSPSGKIGASSTGIAAEAEIIDKIQHAASTGKALLPTGCGTLRHFGNLSNGTGEFLNSSEINEVIEFDPNNQVVTAGAGLALDRLQGELADKNQWLPIRPLFSIQSHSIGGVMALGACGPERMHYGAPRDLILGLRFINGSGQKISTGGKVVKNVAGYDMTRLMIGSAGTLGLITEVTCRVTTIPERCTAISAEGSLAACAALAGKLITSQLSPVFVAAIPANKEDAKIDNESWKLMTGFEGFEKIVAEQLKRTAKMLEKGGLELKNQEEYPVQDGIFGDIYIELGQSAFVLRADVPLDEVAGFVEFLSSRLTDADMFVDFGCGRMLAGFEVMQDEVWRQICDLCDQRNGHVLMERAPVEFKKQNDVFGTARPEWQIMHRIKAALDPHTIFAPGRLPGKV